MVPVAAGRTGWAAWGTREAEEARERYAFHRMRVAREQRENDERLAAKAAEKLADLEAASTLTDAGALARKRAVIEAAMQRARARREEVAAEPATTAGATLGNPAGTTGPGGPRNDDP
jgi:electron transport complex protein RnfB